MSSRQVLTKVSARVCRAVQFRMRHQRSMQLPRQRVLCSVITPDSGTSCMSPRHLEEFTLFSLTHCTVSWSLCGPHPCDDATLPTPKDATVPQGRIPVPFNESPYRSTTACLQHDPEFSTYFDHRHTIDRRMRSLPHSILSSTALSHMVLTLGVLSTTL